jgi:DNA-binding winged helix-turn-helix (wHTH) protein/tetratricopeptide (TPR) repeat protein
LDSGSHGIKETEDKSLKRFPLFFQRNSYRQKMESRNGIIYEFADFRLIPGEGLLLQDGEPVPLSLKSFATLVLLVERHGHLVQKAELIEEVWKNAFVEEAAVSRCVWTIRNALGEDSKSSRFIQTIPRRGYRFVFPVSVVNNCSGSFRLADLNGHDERDTVSPAEQEPANGASVSTVSAETQVQAADQIEVYAEAHRAGKMRSSFSHRWTMLVGLAGIAVITAFLGYYSFVRKGSAGTSRSIVVLPVAPINNADRNVLYEVGIADSLINRLSTAEGVIVRPLNTVREYAEKPKDPIAVGQEQKTDYVLASNYQVADGKVKITAQLYNIASGKVEDTFQMQQEVSTLFAVQDAVVADFGNRLMARFGAKPGERSAKRGTDNEEAYTLYQEAMYLLDKRRPENSKKAHEYLQQAVALDPSYARAWAGIALAIRTSEERDQHKVHQGATEAINKALSIDPNLSAAYSILCLDKLFYSYDFAAAEAMCKRAIELDPISSAAHREYSQVLRYSGRYDEAIVEIRTAIDLEPVSYLNQREYGYALYRLGRFDEAAAQWERLIDLDPTNDVPYQQLVRTFEAQKKYPEAFGWFVRLLEFKQAGVETVQRLYEYLSEIRLAGHFARKGKRHDQRAWRQRF